MSLVDFYGIVRVTDTTRLDRIGIPVFASIRPGAEHNSLCVNAGKGLHSEEARVGAYMEAIEFAAAEFKRRIVEPLELTPRAIVTQPSFRSQFVDLCPLLGRHVDPDEPVLSIYAEDIMRRERVAVPAELVFFPFNENPFSQIFGTSTNGLCSGNSVDEASVHGLCELIERDIQAFNFVQDASVYVTNIVNLEINILIAKIESSGLKPVLRYTPNLFGMPYFQAFILEPSDEAAIAISHGTGCHPIRSIAAVRALTEAAQSRLSYIHGGRDDIIERARYFAAQGRDVELRETARMRERVVSQQSSLPFEQVPDFSREIDGIGVDGALKWLATRMAQVGFRQVVRVTLANKGGLNVVRVIAPGLESFEPNLKRAGPRLLDHVRRSK